MGREKRIIKELRGAGFTAAERKHNAAQRGARILPHSKFASKECPLTVMTDALPDVLARTWTRLSSKT